MFRLFIFLLIPFTLLVSDTSGPGWETRTEWPDDYPRPPKTEKSLFFIQRNLNTNTIVYDLELTEDGMVIPNKPIDVYWLRYGSDGSRKELSWLQSVLAYGYSSKKIKKDEEYRIKLKAYNERYISLKYIAGKWRGIVAINGADAYLNNVYVFTDESGIFPQVKYVDIYGVNVANGEPVKERILNE